MRESGKYNVATSAYNVTCNALIVGYRSRPCLMRRKWSARIITRAFVNAKVFGIVTLEVIHCSIPSLGL